MALENLADRITLSAGASAEAPSTLVLSGATGSIQGTWEDRGSAGRVLMLAPIGEELNARGAAGTRSTPLCVTDARGRFHFGPTPAGQYRLWIEGVDVAGVQVKAGETTALQIEGDSPNLKLKR
jgi:hypothetical protein